jgi:predicted ATPase
LIVGLLWGILGAMYTIEQVQSALDRDDLSDALSKLELFAQEQRLDDLLQWAHSELEGYKADGPAYRSKVEVTYTDPNNVTSTVIEPLLRGVPSLEAYQQEGIIEVTQDPYNNPFTERMEIPSQQLRTVLKEIRIEARRRLQQAAVLLKRRAATQRGDLTAEVDPTGPLLRVDELRMSRFRAFENACLSLGDLTFLVGRNGAGKSTPLKALALLSDAVSDSLPNAVERQGGISSLCHRAASGESTDLGIALVMSARDGSSLVKDGNVTRVLYGFRLGLSSARHNVASVLEEVLLTAPDPRGSYRRAGGTFTTEVPQVSPLVPTDRLLLPVIGGQHELWRTILNNLQRLRMYDLSPAAIGAEQPVGRGTLLLPDGRNAADVLRNLEDTPADIEWLVKHLARVTNGIVQVSTHVPIGARHRLVRFEQQNGGRCSFLASEMSNGTLRALGILLALRQRPTPPLIFIEEIEDALHPAALGILIDAAEASADRCQIVLTSHSPEALSHPAVSGDRVRIIEWRDGSSRIYRLSQETRSLLVPPETVGWLLRSNALWPAEDPCTVAGDFFGLDG